MIVVRVELLSAITGHTTEIGRLLISNDGNVTREDPTRGDYEVRLMRRGAPTTVLKMARVEDYPRQSYTVWELVRRALQNVLGKKPEPMPVDTLVEEVLQAARDTIVASEDR